MDTIDQAHAFLDVDVFGLLVQYLQRRSLIKLSLACRSFYSGFTWKYVRTVDLGTLDGSYRQQGSFEIMRRIISLPDQFCFSSMDLNFTIKHFDPNNRDLISRFLHRVAPSLKSIRGSWDKFPVPFLSRLDPTKIVVLLLERHPMSDILHILRAGCPRLKELRLHAAESEWPQLQEALHLVSQMKGKLESLQIHINTKIPPPGYIDAIKPAVAAHLTTLEYIDVSSVESRFGGLIAEDPCFPLIYGARPWEKEKWPQFERNALESIGLPLYKIRTCGRDLFTIFSLSRILIRGVKNRQDIETIWSLTRHPTSIPVNTKYLMTTIYFRIARKDDNSSLESFVYEKILEMANGVADGTPRPTPLSALITASYFFLMEDTFVDREKYLPKIEPLFDSLLGPQEPPVWAIVGPVALIARYRPHFVEQLLIQKPNWKTFFSDRINGMASQRPLLFLFLKGGKLVTSKDLLPLLAILMRHITIDTTLTNAKGLTIMQYLLKRLQKKEKDALPAGFGDLLNELSIRVPQIFDNLTFDQLQSLCNESPSLFSNLDPQRVLNRGILEKAVESDDVLVKLFTLYDDWYLLSSMPKPSEADYDYVVVAEQFLHLVCEALGNEELREPLKQRLLSFRRISSPTARSEVNSDSSARNDWTL